MNGISIIICSRTGTLDSKLSSSIQNTVGCEFETIIIDNSKNQYSIFQAYNLGIKNSQFSIIVFIHDDVHIHTENWGEILLNLFNDHPQYGLIGVAGARIKTKNPTGWWDCEEKYKLLNIVQHFPDSSCRHEYIGFTKKLEESAVIDGVFMALRRNIKIKFDSKYTGFHGYDFNLCMEIRKMGAMVGVTDQILIEHYSIGNLNKDWLYNIIDLHRKYKNLLPINIISENSVNSEIYALKKLTEKCIKLKQWRLLLYFWFKLWRLDPSSTKHLELIKFFKHKLVLK